ncbi:Microtubule-associated protein [Fagus crenata]
MDIPEKLLQYRYHLTIAVIVPLVLSLLLYAAPRLVNILAFFWPLFASTAVLLMAILAFGGLSQFSTEAHGAKAGQGILEYVGGQPEHT